MVLQLVGKVCSNKMDRTVVVIVELQQWINKYRTWQTYLRKYMAHDGRNTCNIGDVVKIEQLPQKLSTRKAFNVIEIMQRERIVVDKQDAAAQASFQKVPVWAGFAPPTAEAIASAGQAYAAYYGVSQAAYNLARRCPSYTPLFQADPDEPAEAEGAEAGAAAVGTPNGSGPGAQAE